MSTHAVLHHCLEYIVSNTLQPSHGFSTRLGGVSHGHLSSLNLGVHRGDLHENVVENYKIMGNALGFDVEKLVFTKQVHGNVVRVVTEKDWGQGLNSPVPTDCDGLITNVSGTVLVAFSADCTPILLWDNSTGAVGAIHAGWRGTAAGIAQVAVESMVKTFGSKPQNISAVIGPCISKCCFETHSDVPQAMVDALGDLANSAISPVGEKYMVDLKEINRIWLQKAGVTQVDICPDCTACQPDRFWSHRRVGDKRGSLAAMIVAP